MRPSGGRDGAERMGYTVVADILVGIGTGLALRSSLARVNSPGCQILGTGGFHHVSLSPPVGLVPTLPGAAVAPHLQRYVVTAVCSASGFKPYRLFLLHLNHFS